MIQWIKNILGYGESKEELEYPKRIRVCLNRVAKINGIKDKENLVIQIVEGKDNIIEEHPYTEELLEATKKVYELPLEIEDFEEDEDFEFTEFEDLNILKYKK